MLVAADRLSADQSEYDVGEAADDGERPDQINKVADDNERKSYRDNSEDQGEYDFSSFHTDDSSERFQGATNRIVRNESGKTKSNWDQNRTPGLEDRDLIGR